MKRAPTALRAIGGFGVAVAVLSVAATAAVVVLAPEPAQQRMTGAEAVAALRGEETSLARTVESAPEGQRAQLIEDMIATELDRPISEVRVVWPEGSYESFSSRTFRLPAEIAPDRDREASSRPFVMIRQPDGTLETIPSPRAESLIQFSLLSIRWPAFAASVRQKDGQWLTVAPSRPFLTGWQRNILIALAVSLLLLAPLAWVFARRLTRPFRTFSSALGDSAGPIPQEGPRELREAAAAIAAMRTKLTGEAAERARILTAIAHDLRTPLTGLRLRVENVDQPQRTRMVEDIERMQSMIGEVLGFARDAAVPGERVSVRPFIQEIIAGMGHPQESITLLPGDNASITMSALSFRRVIENLVRNAVEYAGAGAISIKREGGDVVLAVSDSGPGIAAEDRERLVRPFERGETSRNRGTGGTGLGLSIVREFAVRCRGGFVLKDAPGGGTLAELRLPAI